MERGRALRTRSGGQTGNTAGTSRAGSCPRRRLPGARFGHGTWGVRPTFEPSPCCAHVLESLREAR